MTRFLFAATAVAALCVCSSFGAEGLLPTLESPSGMAPADVARWIGQLDAAEFGDRQDASRHLSDAGKAIVPELEKAVAGPSREVAGRALEILKQHFQQGDAELKQAARDSLARLAESQNASIAQRARNVIEPPKQVAAMSPVGPGFRGPPFPMQPFPPPPLARPPVAPPTRSISISEINGHREVKIEDQTRITTMQTTPAGGIEVNVHDKIRNQQVKTLQAKDAEDLKAKDGELGQLYERYQQRGPKSVGGPPLPAQIGAVPAAGNDLARRMLETIETSIDRYKARLPGDPTAQRTIDSLERLKQQYRSTLQSGNAPVVPSLETAQRPVR